MKITELEGRDAKLSPRSITVKSESGKTAGVIHAECFKTLPPRRNFDYWKHPGVAAIWNAWETENLYIVDNELYFLYDIKKDEFYEKYKNDLPEDGYDTECYRKRKALLETAKENGIKIIRFRSV